MILSERSAIDRHCASGIWGDATLMDLFEGWATRQPEKLALADPPNRSEITDGPPHRMTYAQLAATIRNLTYVFRSLQLENGDVIAFQLPNTVEQVIVILAAVECGLIVSPLPLLWREHEFRTALPLIGPKVLLTSSNISDRDHAELMCTAAAENLTIRAVLSFGAEVPDGVVGLDAIFTDADIAEELGEIPDNLPSDANDVATVCWVGDDALKPCPVPRSHNQWIAAGMMNLLECDIDGNSIILSPYPMTGIVPIGALLVPWLLSGATLCLHHPFDLPVFAQQLRSETVTITALPPAVIDLLKAEGEFDSDGAASSLQTLTCVWPGPVLPKDAEEHAADLMIPVVDVRMLGEMAYISKKRVAGERPAQLEHGELTYPTYKSGGAVLMETRVKGGISSNDKVASLLTGDLMIKSPMMFDAYYPPAIDGVDEPLIAKDSQGFINTGFRCLLTGTSSPKVDIIRKNSNVIFYGGLSVSANELDQLYAEYQGISDAAAFTFEDPVMGERILAAIVPNPGETISFSDFVDYLNDRQVAPYKVPDRLVTVKNIPRDTDGSVLRNKVMEQI